LDERFDGDVDAALTGGDGLVVCAPVMAAKDIK